MKGLKTSTTSELILSHIIYLNYKLLFLVARLVTGDGESEKGRQRRQAGEEQGSEEGSEEQQGR